MSPIDIKSRFALKRSNFVLNPLSPEDAECFADRTGVNVSKIVEDLNIDLATGLPPKRMLWGPYGGGKTHTLLHTMQKLSELTEVRLAYIECPDLSKRSTFLELYREGIMRGLGQDYVMNLFETFRTEIGIGRPEDIIPKIMEKIEDEELAKAVNILTNMTDKNRLLLWSWFSGISVSKSDLIDLGQTQDLTSAEPARLAKYITIVGKLVDEIDGKTLILILDEMDRIGFVGSDTIVQFRTAFTRLMDPNQKYISVLLGLSAQNFPELPDIFSERGPIVSRIGRDSVQEVPMLDDVDVEPFIKKIIEYFRDTDQDISEKINNAREETDEDIEEYFYPFTNDAIEAIKVGVGQEMTPREITLKMTRAAGKAHTFDKKVITSEYIA